MGHYLEDEFYASLSKDLNIFHFIQESTLDGIWFWDLENPENEWMDDRFWEVLGYDPKDMPHKTSAWQDIVNPDDFKKAEEKINEYISNPEKPYDQELRYAHKDGSTVWIRCRGRVISNEKGKPIRMVGVHQNITDLKNSQAELKEKMLIALESQERYKAMFVNAPLAFQSLNLDGYLLDVNPQWLKILGYDREDVIGKWFGDFLHSDYVDEFRQNFPKFKAAGCINGVQFKMVRKDGSFIYVEFEGCIGYDEKGNFRQTYCTFKDITSEYEAKEKLSKSEETYRVLAESAKQVILTHTLEGKITYVNKFALDLFKRKKSEIIGTNIATLISHAEVENMNRRIGQLLEGEKSIHHFEMEYMLDDGNVLTLDVTGSPIMKKDQVDSILVLATDITTRKESEEALRVAKEKAEESNALKTEFLHNMSHEIRTPMNGIVGFAEMLNDEGLSPEKRRYFTQIVQSSGKQLLKIIDDILEISSLETKQVKAENSEVNLNDVVMELFSVFSLKARDRQLPIYTHKHFHDNESFVIADRVKLMKILSNLLDNAIKYTAKGFVEIGYHVEGNKLIFYVKDTGVGISKGSLELIFERFSQEEREVSRKQGGLGLGLSISKENALLLGGDVTVESDKNKGATFYLTIPYVPVLKDKSEEKIPVGKDKIFTILLAEDEGVNSMYIEELIEQNAGFKYNLLFAKNGKEAVEACQGDEKIDLVLMDVKMPVMSGYEAADRIKRINPDIPIIAQTAYSTDVDRAHAFEHSCDDFISKPLEKSEFMRLVRKNLGLKSLD